MSYIFEYKGNKAETNEFVKGEIEANDGKEAKNKLKKSGIIVKEIHIIKDSAGRGGASSVLGGPGGIQREKMSDTLLSALKDKYTLWSMVVVLIIFAAFWIGNRGAKCDVYHKIVNELSLSENSDSKAFFIRIKKRTTKKEIRQVARYVFKTKKSSYPKMEGAMFYFYYPDQKYLEKYMAVSTLAFNIERFGAWKEEFSNKFLSE